MARGTGKYRPRIHKAYLRRTETGSDRTAPGVKSPSNAAEDPAAEAGKSLLETRGRHRPVTPRHGCRMGICHQCSCRKVAGTVVDMRTGQESDAGEDLIQLCISAPKGEVTLDI